MSDIHLTLQHVSLFDRMTSGQGDLLFSPESTITSLLASSGHLRGTLRDNDPSLAGIRYRDRDYESATEALEAYIADFDRSLHTSETSTGSLQLQKNLLSSALPRTEFRNKDGKDLGFCHRL